MTTEQPLEQNDLISFGFNTASVYDIKDKNAFIYKLSKEDIVTIDIDDSDSDDDDNIPTKPKEKFIEIDNKVMVIDSDSDPNYSGDECLQDIDDAEDEENSDIDSFDSLDPSDDDSDSVQYYESDDEKFVVTKTILKCATPTETISLDEDDDDVPADEENDKTENGTVEPSTSTKVDEKKEIDEKPEESGVKLEDEESKDGEPKDGDQKHTVEGSENENDDEKPPAKIIKLDPEPSTSKAELLSNIKKRLAEMVPKKIGLIEAKPQKVRRRRQTMLEADYNERLQNKKVYMEMQKQLRRERLAIMGEKEKVAREATTEIVTEPKQINFVPKVKNTSVSRGEQLCSDLLANDPPNPKNT